MATETNNVTRKGRTIGRVERIEFRPGVFAHVAYIESDEGGEVRLGVYGGGADAGQGCARMAIIDALRDLDRDDD